MSYEKIIATGSLILWIDKKNIDKLAMHKNVIIKNKNIIK